MDGTRFLLLVALISMCTVSPGCPHFFDPDKCPLGWQSVSEQCVMLHPELVSAEEAQAICESYNSTLLNVIQEDGVNQEIVSDVSELLQHVFGSGLHETAWLIAGADSIAISGVNYEVWIKTSIGPEPPRFLLLRKGHNRIYDIVQAAPSATYPFICSLKTLSKRILLYQQAILPSGVPRIIDQPEGSYHYTERAEGAYVLLPCRATGNPLPQIRWYRNGVDEVDVSAGNSTLLISGGSLLIPIAGGQGSSGDFEYASYHCTASNHLGAVRSVSTVVRPAFIAAFRSSRMDVFTRSFPGGARIECEAPLHYPKSHSYSWMFDGSTDRFVAQNERIFISHEGTLYFSYNIKQDATSYACSLALSTTQSGNYGPFFNLRLPQRINEHKFAPKIDEIQPQAFPEHPRVGGSVFLECFAYGRPPPRYRWSRVDGRTISAFAKLTNFNRVLKIENVQAEDEGRYKCTAENELGKDSAEVTLVIQMAPEIFWPLQDQIVASNSTATFSCRLATTDGNVEWFKNAIPITPLLMNSDDRQRFVINNNMLTIAKTRPEDSGIYQCIVSNEVGAKSSSARLTVSDFKPRFDGNIMPKKVFAVVGSDVMVPCIYHSSPASRVTWFRQNGDSISTEGRVRYTEDAVHTLYIDGALPTDEDEYVCAAANSKGEAQRGVHLIIIDKPNVVVSPQAKFLSDDVVNISCEIEMSCNNFEECPEVLFDWTLNNRPIRSLPRFKDIRSAVYEKLEKRERRGASKVKQVFELELPPSLGAHRVGRFACTSLYGGGASDFEPLPAPLSPVDLKISDVSSTSAKLSWRQPAVPHRGQRTTSQIAVDAYKIEMRTKLDKYWRSFPKGLLSSKQGQISSFTLTGLISNHFYQFRVKARGGSGFGRPSKSTEWVQTRPSRPTNMVKNLRWRKLDNYVLLIEWDPFEKIYHNGPNLHYRLWWAYTERANEGKTVLTYGHSHLIHVNKSAAACIKIIFRIQAANDAGDGPKSGEIVAYMSNKAPSRIPTQLAAIAMNSTCVKFHWKWSKKVDCENTRGVKIVCEPLTNVSRHLSVHQSIPSEYTHWLLNGLMPRTEYACRLAAFDQNGRIGKFSEDVTVITKPPAPKEPPLIRKWKLRRRGDGYSTYLEWSPVVLHTDVVNGSQNAGYKIRIYVSETASKPVLLRISESELQNKRSPAARIDGLKLMYYYTLRISGYNEGGEGPQSDPYPIRIGSTIIDLDSASSFLVSSSFLKVFVLIYLLQF